MFQMMLKRILVARRQKPQLKCLCAACFGCVANLSIWNIALYIYYSKILYNNAAFHGRETVVPLPDVNGVFWLCCASPWIRSSYYAVKPPFPKQRCVEVRVLLSVALLKCLLSVFRASVSFVTPFQQQ